MLKVTIIWTRSKDLWHEDRSFFSEKSCLRLPCINFQDYSIEKIKDQLQGVSFPDPQLLIGVLTSAHTIKSLKQMAFIFEKCQKWYAVGEKTRDFFTSLKLAPTIHVPKGVSRGSELASYLCSEYRGKKCIFLLPGAQKRAYRIDKHLHTCSLQTISFDTYKVESGLFGTNGSALDQKSVTNKLEGSHKLFVCFASPSAVAGFVDGLAQLGLRSILQRCHAVSIGPTTSKACRAHFSVTTEAPSPDVAILAGLAKNLLVSDV